ncbi:MAG: glycosyltransferase family 4 protein [Pseudomonadota bacterium]|nr:glycosyltransferase family 4 protein [Pseudomonadota bacterium]
MRIAIIHHQYRRKGGMERYLFDLLSGLSAVHDHTTVVVYKQDNTQALVENSRVIKYWLNWLPRVLRKFYFSKRLERQHHRADYDCTISLMRSSNQEIVVSGGTHCGYLMHTDKRASLWDRWEIRAEQKSFAASKAIIAYSHMIAKEIENYYSIDKRKIHCLFPPINLERFNGSFRANRTALQKKWGINPAKLTLLFTSGGHKREGIDPLLKAFTRLPSDQYQLIIAGHKPKRYKLPDNVHYLGFVDEIAELYAAVDFTILPSFYEPFGLVVPESLACGTPVIISEYVGAKELLREEYGIVIPAVTVNAIQQAIEQAREQKFDVPEDFAQRHQLTLSVHIEKLKAVMRRVKG